ncbi:MAG: hypothetical protein CO021_05425 [Deltaproteobacteria bacterium CG_4_9_14_0_2_um_filter_42_21]|nr:MAG: hypothetical protein CO021_05425 [Deltaproteobacteria bacterium CG_4_9_14_0_2_um_filter_42_21]
MRKQKQKSALYHTYLLESLQDDEEAAHYINAALEEIDDPEALLLALRNVAQARGMSKTAKKE